MNGLSKGIKLLVAIGVLAAARAAIAQEPGEVPVAAPDVEGLAVEDAVLRPLNLSEPQQSELASINDRFRRQRADVQRRTAAAGEQDAAVRSARARLRSQYWNTLTTDQRETVRTRSRQRLDRQRAFRQQGVMRTRGDARHRARPRSHRPNRPTARATDRAVDRAGDR